MLFNAIAAKRPPRMRVVNRLKNQTDETLACLVASNKHQSTRLPEKKQFRHRNTVERSALSTKPWAGVAGARPGKMHIACPAIFPRDCPMIKIEDSFDIRTLANMDVALDRVCGRSPIGGQHDVRKRVAQAIVRCAKDGRTTLGALTEAGEKALWRIAGNAA
jgi:hypothetical protein